MPLARRRGHARRPRPSSRRPPTRQRRGRHRLAVGQPRTGRDTSRPGDARARAGPVRRRVRGAAARGNPRIELRPARRGTDAVRVDVEEAGHRGHCRRARGNVELRGWVLTWEARRRVVPAGAGREAARPRRARRRVSDAIGRRNQRDADDADVFPSNRAGRARKRTDVRRRVSLDGSEPIGSRRDRRTRRRAWDRDWSHLGPRASAATSSRCVRASHRSNPFAHRVNTLTSMAPAGSGR